MDESSFIGSLAGSLMVGGVGAYVGVRVGLAELRATLNAVKESADRAHRRIDDILRGRQT